jgi:membrane protein required for colicin V production
MHWLDFTLIALLGVAAVVGAWSGLLMQAFRWIGFAVAAYAAVSLHGWADRQLRAALLDDADANVSRAVAYGVVFLVAYSAVFVITRMLERGVDSAELQFYNRLLGALLAAAKLALVVGAICFGLQRLPFEEPKDLMKATVLAPALARGTEALVQVLPDKYKNNVNNSWQQVRETMPAK